MVANGSKVCSIFGKIVRYLNEKENKAANESMVIRDINSEASLVKILCR